ncbi:MAG TPA: glycosyltransferase family 39 protein [Patescibacteria group bacterium]|nr:glycosyltransferase family 39 protein [Patescibacteria group bacterium]
MTTNEGNTAAPRPHAERRRFLVSMGILAGGALVVRAAFLGCRMVLSGDEVHYAESLHRFMEGRFTEGFSDYWSFFYPFLALPFGKIYGSAEPALRLLSVICGGAVVVPCMLIARRLWGDRAALLAGILIALHPSLIQFSTAAMTESLSALLVSTALYLLIRFLQDGGRWFFVAGGVVLGLAYLTRQEAQFILALVVVVVLLAGAGTVPRGKRLVRAAVLAAFFIVTILPSVFLLRAKTGRWTGGSKASVNLSSPLIWEDGIERERYVYGLNESGTGRRIDEIGRESVLATLWRQRDAVVSRYFPNLTRGVALLPNLLASPFLLLLVPLGLFGRGWRRGDRMIEFVLLLVGILPFVLYAVFRIDFRYLVPFLPVYLLWGARGCGVLVSWLRENVSPRPILSVITLFVILASLVPFTVRRYALLAASQPVEYREIGRWIRDNGGGGAMILAPSGWSVGYYAGNPLATFIPWTDPDGLIRYARYHRFEYLVLGTAYIEHARPALEPLVREPEYPGFELIHTFTDRSGGEILLYRLGTTS